MTITPSSSEEKKEEEDEKLGPFGHPPGLEQSNYPTTKKRPAVAAVDLTGLSSDEDDDGRVGGGDSLLVAALRHPQQPVPSREAQSGSAAAALSSYLATIDARDGRLIFTAFPPASFRAHQQKDKWSCGYRNLQNLIGFILRMPSHPHFADALIRGGLACDRNHFGGNDRAVASTPDVQRAVQRAWDAGYDPDGSSDPIRGQLVGSKTWIGTPECAAVLRSVGVPVEVRAWSNDRGEDDRSDWPASAKSATECMMAFMGHYFHRSPGWTANSDGDVDLPPVYLQRRGHSMTCVGVAMSMSGRNKRRAPTALLISDTAKQQGAVREVSASKLKKTAAWEVGYIAGPQLLQPGEAKKIGGNVFAAMS